MMTLSSHGRRALALTALAVIAGAVIGGAAAAAAREPSFRNPSAAPAAPAEVVVRFRAGVGPGAREAAREVSDVRFKRSMLLPNAQLVRVEEDGSVREAVRELESRSEVLYAEPNFRYEEMAAPTNDPDFGKLWSLHNSGQTLAGASYATHNPGTPGIDLNVLAAWDTTRGGGQTIAVVDGGVAKDHPDLVANLVGGGYDFVQNDADPDDYHFHGSHVAGTAAAVGDNGIGIVGVAHEAKILPVRAMDGNGSGLSSDITNGIVHAADNGAAVINLSLSGPGRSQAMQDAIERARTKDAIVIAAAGNEDNDNDAASRYPCSYPNANLVCVAAIDQAGALASFSNFGATSVDVGAPGTNIRSAAPDFATLFSTNFEAQDPFEAGGGWGRGGTPDSWSWTSALSVSPTHSITDGPPGSDYAADASNGAFLTTPLDLSGRRGCRTSYNALTDTEGGLAPDVFRLDVFDAAADRHNVDRLSGRFSGPRDRTLSAVRGDAGVDGDPSVQLQFALAADGDANVGEGTFVDDVSVRCRDNGYDASSYRFLNGTSMAAPAISGVAALVRSAAPNASADQLAAAIKSGVDPLPSLQGRTTSGGLVNAAKAIAVATAPAATAPAAAPPASSPSPIRPPLPPTRIASTKPCAGFTGRALAGCKLRQEVKRKCGRKTGRRKRICEKRVRALAKCRGLKTRTKRQRRKKAACISKARRIGAARPRSRR